VRYQGTGGWRPILRVLLACGLRETETSALLVDTIYWARNSRNRSAVDALIDAHDEDPQACPLNFDATDDVGQSILTRLIPVANWRILQRITHRVSHQTFHRKSAGGATALTEAVGTDVRLCVARDGITTSLLGVAPPDCSGQLLFGPDTWLYCTGTADTLRLVPVKPEYADVETRKRVGVRIVTLDTWIRNRYGVDTHPPRAVVDRVEQQTLHYNAAIHLALKDSLPVVPLVSLVSLYLLAGPPEP
jgi:hypothetical protein